MLEYQIWVLELGVSLPLEFCFNYALVSFVAFLGGLFIA